MTLMLRALTLRKSGVPISTRTCWQAINRYIICLATGDVDIEGTEIIRQRCSERFPEADEVVVSLSGENIPSSENGQMISITSNELNFFGIPNKHIRKKLRNLNADIAVDLTTDFNPLSAYVCLISNARMKICFSKPRSELVFNYQIAPHADSKGPDRYRVLARYIG